MSLIDAVEKVLGELHTFQKEKALRIAREHRPNISLEDLLNPDDFADIVNDPRYAYEDGQAAGVLAAKVALRSFLKSQSLS